MNEYIPSNINLTKKNGVLSVTKGKQPTTTKVRSKLASRKVIFEDPLCLNDKDIVADELLVQKEADYLTNNHNIDTAFSNQTDGNLESINDDIELIDLKGKVQDLSVQLEEICKYSRSPLNENDVCFCHDLVGGKCLLPQNRTYTDSPRLKTPPKVWFSKPDCCQSCTVPCCVKADSSSTNLLNNPEKLRPLTDEELLQDNLNDIRHRLSLLQDNYASKHLPSSVSNKIERDIDEHLEKLNKENSIQKQYHHLPTNRKSTNQTIKGKSLIDQKKSVDHQSLKSKTKPTIAQKQFQLNQQQNRKVPKEKFIHSSYNKLQLPNNKLKCENITKSFNEKQDKNLIKNISNYDNDDDDADPEITLDKLEKYLETSDMIMDSKAEDLKTKHTQQETKLDETKEMVNELRSVYREIKDLLLFYNHDNCFQNVRNRIDENNSMKLEQTEKIDTTTNSNTLLSNSQPVLTPGTLLPSIRLAMEYSGKTISPTDDITQLISNLPDDPLVKASTALYELNRRRNNLENNLAALESSHNDQSIFGLLDLLTKDRSSAEKARIQAMINDAIEKVVHDKKSEKNNRPIGRISRLTQPKSQLTTQTKQMRDTSSSCSSPTRSRNVIDLFHQPKLYSTDRSPSPVTLTSPWRLNRRRAKRPLYPRSVNDPVRPRTAVLRLSDENLTGSFQSWYSQNQSVISSLNVLQITNANNNHGLASDLLQVVTPEVLVRSCDQWSSTRVGVSSLQRRMQRSNSKIVRFIDHQNDETIESTTEPQQIQSNKYINMQAKIFTKPNSGIIPLGMYQYSLAIGPSKKYNKEDKLISTDTSGLLHEKGIGFHFQSNQSNEQPSNNFNALSRTELEDNILSRLVLQISDQLAKNQSQSHDTSSKENLQHLVETALLERIGSMLSPASVSPNPTNQLLRTEQQQLKTPSSSPDRTSHFGLLDIPTPMDSINKSELPYPDDLVHTKSKTPEPKSNWQPYNPDEESIFRNSRSPPTNPHHISTPEPSFADNFSLRSKLRSQSSSPIKQKSVMISPFPSSPQKYPSEKNVSEKSAEFNSQSLNSNSTALIDTKSSSFTEQFSLTAPDTFSDGMWLLDRSEGEAPYPVPYNKLKLIMSNMEPIRSSTTRRNNSLTQTFSLSKSTSNSSNNSSSDNTKQLKQDEISPGQLPYVLTTKQQYSNDKQMNPINNPLLHLLALKNSNQIKRNQLTHYEYDEMNKLLNQLKQIRQCSNNNNNNNNSTIIHSPSLEWLANLSGSPLPQSNLNQLKNVKHCKSNMNLVNSPINKLKIESSTSIDDKLRQSIKQDHSNKSNHSTNENDSSKISMLRQVELVHSDDSEATTIDDETYEDDFTGEQTN
ncbi:unnamed protein product [Schistosoma margrebowiei]|uniref:Uncharacterized protein n=1 Tax=Schistosoma margrebowiei TaxID=48269 RepID=A0A183LKZ6_9TREM|nr:unnamed protein product [Schistosoma margrebowiei]